ncbi:hypothetical protein M0R45_037125 [Rubus argutus]|uniref:Uncharacterized protein n=1 Tax=Rubus argutus TaxID=59490 RepID=A0AAW1W111_RUBAR
MFTPKSISYASSASSLDGWSSESSSSSMNQRFISNVSQASGMVHCVGHDNQETSLPDENIKPSGLQVPSPKIGFFNEGIALVRASGSKQFHYDGEKNVHEVLKRVNTDHTKENEEPNRQHNSDRENTYFFKNRIEGLTKQVGAIDLGCDVVMELKGDKTVFHT